MIVAIVCLLMVTAVCFSLVQYSVAAHRQSVRQGWGLQSAWLAESALPWAAARLRSDPEFSGDEWVIETIGSANDSGRVLITLAADPEQTEKRTITATADFPDDPTDRVRTTRTLTLTLSETDPATTN